MASASMTRPRGKASACFKTKARSCLHPSDLPRPGPMTAASAHDRQAQSSCSTEESSSAKKVSPEEVRSRPACPDESFVREE